MCEEEVNSDERGAESYPRVKREAERDCHLRRDMPSTLSRDMMPFKRGSCSGRDTGSKEPNVLLCIHVIGGAGLLLPGGHVRAVRKRKLSYSSSSTTFPIPEHLIQDLPHKISVHTSLLSHSIQHLLNTHPDVFLGPQ
jgi:hypothetical protein